MAQATTFYVVLQFNPEIEPDRFEFETAAELRAFMDGVDAASGWMDYDILENSLEAEYSPV